ncbi:hypothetical protein ONS95_008233 [Cadophora gregata]|nr:uncharacterized protein ONS95_008233 [Cadophora gregata]KAK0100274.1 hypothetical protein ONS96_007556 [Cadophora gregata f. sp. sojae]KAK0126650.1 hypothetical protein ONS95_008233 [Cadophora gregata]
MAFISGASNDNLTRDANKNWWQRIWFRPQVLQDVGKVNTKSQILGCDAELPIFISPAGLAKTAGPDGELALAAGASSTGIIQCVSTTASYPLDEIMGAAPTGYPFFFQLYINKDRAKTEALIKYVTKLGVKAILITIDLPVVSKREADERAKSESSYTSRLSGTTASGAVKSSGIARNVGSFIDPTFCWDDIAWVRKHTDLPVLLKGIQRAKDARNALNIGCQGLVLSNHGGRALDSAPPSVLTLLELHMECPQVFEKMEILIDGGIRRGSDVLKAVCLGATAVGLGRPFMYALSYGKEGVEHAVNIIKDELQTAMRLCGISDLSQASPDMLNTTEADVYLKKGSDTRHPYARKTPRKSKL